MICMSILTNHYIFSIYIPFKSAYSCSKELLASTSCCGADDDDQLGDNTTVRHATLIVQSESVCVVLVVG